MKQPFQKNKRKSLTVLDWITFVEMVTVNTVQCYFTFDYFIHFLHYLFSNLNITIRPTTQS